MKRLIARWVDAWFAFHPHQATEKGYARYDARAPSYAPRDVERLRAAVARGRAQLDGLTLPENDPHALELELLRAHLDAALFPIDTLDALETNPLWYVQSGLDALDALDLRLAAGDLAAARALAPRLSGLDALLAQSRAQLHAPVDIFLAVALDMLQSALEDLGERFHDADAPTREAADRARRGIDATLEHFARRPHDTRPFSPMGPEAFARLLRVEHMLTQPLSDWTALAEATLRDAQAQLRRWRGDANSGDAPEGFSREEVWAYYERELTAVEQFVRDAEVVTLPEGALELRPIPAWLEPLSPQAFYVPPVAFGGGPRTGFLFLRAVPDLDTTEARDRYWEQVALRRMRNLIVHEVWPGHHVQLLHAAHHPDPLRKYRDNDVMIEGWALYSEQLMLELGLWRDLPSPRPIQSRAFRAVRVLVDVGLHTGALTLEACAARMAAEFGGHAPWIDHELRRYAAEPGQAMSYLVGHHLLNALRDELCPHRDPPALRRFHDAFLAEGSIPLPLLARHMRLSGRSAPPAPT